MYNLVQSTAANNFLAEISRQDQVEYSVEYFKAAESYKFTARKMIFGEPIRYTVMITAEAVEENGMGSALTGLRMRALNNFVNIAQKQKGNE